MELSYLACVFLMTSGMINFQHVIVNETFDLLLKNFNISHNSFVLRGRALIFCIRVPYDKAFPMVP